MIPALAVPLSIVGTFGVMYLLGYSLNNLSLMALTISTGFVVDDAIVMIENISRFIEEGESPLQAALKGSEQIGFTILSLTVSLIAVLIPLLFMGDIVGRLFREFAITLAVTIIVSAFVSLTLTPMMAAKLLRHQREEEQGWFYRDFGAWFQRGHRFLRAHTAIRPALSHHDAARHRGHAGRHHSSLHLCPQGILSRYRTPALILGVSEAPQNISFAAMAQRQQALGQRDSEGSRRRKSLVLHRHRRHQHHDQQRPHPDQSEAARRTRQQHLRLGRSFAACSRNLRRSTASRFSCSRCRT